MSAPFGGMPTRWDPDVGPSPRVALIVPGSGYSPAHPLLEFGRQSLNQHGWTVQQLWWDQPSGAHGVDARADWVCDQVRSALESETEATQLLVVAKSLGTLAAPVALERGLDAIWLTPLFGSAAASITAIGLNAQAGASQLLIGGGADPEWDPVQARALGCDVVDIADATHFMHMPGDAVRSAQIQLEVTGAVDAFLQRLDATR